LLFCYVWKNGGNNVMKKEIVALYVRVSTQEQAREGYSIEEQKDKLIKYAEAHD
jgi:site-specific DNA recombinase